MTASTTIVREPSGRQRFSAAPAVDLREGRCVQLVGGRIETERVSIPDPVAQAVRWRDIGFRILHVVDLDAALSLGENRSVIQEIVAATDASVQVGGGVRDEEAVGTLIDSGVDRVIVGTRAVDDPRWLETVAVAHPGRIMVAADVLDGKVLRRGWTEATDTSIPDLFRGLDALPLAGILCTDVGREGRMAGVDMDGARNMVGDTRHPLWLSGGISTLEELRTLRDAGAAGAVLGMAIYTGVLPPTDVAKEFGS
jgi:phosphoribosylformimino-5-aminoimidazole carboxamide ribotide isomerase